MSAIEWFAFGLAALIVVGGTYLTWRAWRKDRVPSAGLDKGRKVGPSILMSQELLDDARAVEQDYADTIAWHRAVDEGRVVYRGGGWWTVDGGIVRGRQAAVKKVLECQRG